MIPETVLEDLSPEALAAANEANYSEYYVYRVAHDSEVYDEPGLVMRVTGSPAPILNFVTRAHIAPENVDASIAKVINRFKEKQVPGYWYVGPSTRPTEMGDMLERHGFIKLESRPGMGIDLEILKNVPMPPGMVIEPIRDEGQLKGWVDVMLPGFEIPESFGGEAFKRMLQLGLGPDLPAQNFLGSLDGKPVGVSTVFYGAGVAGIYSVATLPEARGKGIGTAMTLKPLMDARQKGYRAGILQSSPMGLSVYQKIGFREACRINVYLWKPG